MFARPRGHHCRASFSLLAYCLAALFAVGFPAQAQTTMPQSAAAFFPILPLEAAANEPPSLLPVASNHPLDDAHAGLTRAVVVIHDFSRDAGKSLSIVSSLAGAQNSETMILAPQFLLDSDIARFSTSLPENGRDFARWSLGGWEVGDTSQPQPAKKGISSFTALDILLMYLGDRASFPDMQQIVVAGHGSGADFVQRYAAVGRAADILAQQNLPVRFAVANASSYLYLTTTRPRAGHPGFSPPDADACKDYNSWPYGLNALNPYSKSVGLNQVKTSFAARHIGYIVGEDSGKADPAPDTSCAAQMQGPDRPHRAISYVTYAGSIYGEAAIKNQEVTVVPNAGYDAAALYGSICGMTLLFGDGDCTPPTLRASNAPQ